MRNLSQWLQTNPFIVVAMFIVSTLSGIAGLLLGWKQLYQDYLSKSIEIPVWLLLLCFLLLPGVVAVYRSMLRSPKKDLQKVEGKRFGVQQVVVDGRAFERCEFHGTEVVFQGTKNFSLTNCVFVSPRFSFDKHAALTVSALTGLYTDSSFRPLIEATIDNIRKNQMPQAVAPSTF